jgi:hypothetical protein
MSCHLWFTLGGNVLSHLVWFTLGWNVLPPFARDFELTNESFFDPRSWMTSGKDVLVGFKFVLFFWWCARDFQNPSLLTYLPIYLLIYLLIYIYIYIYLSIYLHIYLSTFYLFIYLFIYILTYLLIYPPLPRDGWKTPI